MVAVSAYENHTIRVEEGGSPVYSWIGRVEEGRDYLAKFIFPLPWILKTGFMGGNRKETFQKTLSDFSPERMEFFT